MKKKVRRVLFLYFIVGMAFVQLDKSSIGFAALTMNRELGLSATALGFAAGIFSLASFLMQVPAGLFFERFGAKRWLTTTMVGWGLVCMAQSQVHATWEIVVLRFLLGLLEAGFLPGLFVLVSIWFRGNNHGVAVAAIQIGTACAGIVGGPLAGILLSHPIPGFTSWRGLFLVEGALTVAFAVYASRLVDDRPMRARWLSEAERDCYQRYLSSEQRLQRQVPPIEASGLRGVLGDWRVWLLTVSYACSGWAAGTFAFFTPTLLKTAGKGMDLMAVGALAAVPYLINALVAFGWGAHADRHNERRWHTMAPILVAITGLLLYPVASNAAVAVLAVVLVHAGNTGVYVNFWASCTMLVGRSTIVRSTAVINSGSAMATFLAPIAFGHFLDSTGGTTVGLAVCAAVLVLNFLVLNLFFARHGGGRAEAAP